MKLDENEVVSFRNWYPTFRRYTFKSVYIPVPQEVLEYLRLEDPPIPVEALSSEEHVGDENEEKRSTHTFPEFSALLKSTLDRFGGSAFIKMNWSAPTDVSFFTTGDSLKCTSLLEAYSLLLYSDKIYEDMKISHDQFLVMKKWEEIQPGSEFRCFVVDRELVGITQRSVEEFHDFILLNSFYIVKDIKTFFEDTIKNELLISNYVFDVTWNTGCRIKIVDFGRLDKDDVECYLFTIEEVRNLKYDERVSPHFKFVDSVLRIA